MQFNEFNRRLNDASMDEDAKRLMMYMYEVMMEVTKTLDATLNVVNALADSLKNMTVLHESTQQRVKDLMRERHAEVKSIRGEDF